MKQPHQSLTIVTGAGALVAAIVALVLHYTGGATLPLDVLGGTWTTVVWAVVAVVLRYKTQVPVRRPGKKTTLVSLVLFAGMMAACPPRELRGKHLEIEIDEGPPCVVKMILDGEIVDSVRADKPCRME